MPATLRADREALRDLGAFVDRTVVEDEHTYAVRTDDGALLDGAEQIERAHARLSADGRRRIVGILGCELNALTPSSIRSSPARRLER